MAYAKQALAFIRLKSGVSLTPTGGDYLLALPSHGLLLTQGAQIQMARAFNGRNSTLEIATGLSCEVDAVGEFVELLKSHGFVDELGEPIAQGTGDLSEQLIRSRGATERALIAHRAGSRDGGAQEFQNREAATILISGENRLARNLLVGLQASGFTNTRLISRAFLPARLTGADICGLAVRASDIGKLRREFTAELIRNSQIARGQQVAKPFPDLIISTVPVEWDYVQRWMSEGSRHLHINQIVGQEIEVGPLVIPGATPCLRCVALIKRDNGASVGHESLRTELPSAAVAFISGLLALAVGGYFATGATPFHAASYWYDLLNPLRAPEVRHWNFHPECGCR